MKKAANLDNEIQNVSMILCIYLYLVYYLHNVCSFSIQVNRNSNKVAVFLDNLCKVTMTLIHKNMNKKKLRSLTD